MKSKVLASLVMMILVISLIPVNLALAAEFPYPATSYDEPYRGQFHFSPQGGWMNDVNGLWYSGGTYHLSFQHYPHGLAWAQMHWGRATSNDMMHWTQQSIMLEPGVVPGDCFSGSAVVDVNNTSGFKTGSNPVFVAIYTATTRGTCLAYSNDLGANWQAYSGNPVNVGGPNADTRDPHVFWHAPTNKWVCLLYENGTTFYTSSNLKNWTKVSNFNWGYECPDFYQLPVDGDTGNQKWVLQDASGNYYLGQFNGTTFTPDTGGPYKMDQGPDFYAAQTFYRVTFPDSRLIQMAWMDNWNGGLNTSPWSRDATFPAELKLKTFPEGIRIARTPIAQISNLYGTTQHWNTETLTGGRNLLGGKFAKCYDLEAVFNLSGATATQINFQLANKLITYNITNKTLLGKTLNPINNQVKIRILADWSQFEVFGNDGQLSYTEQFGFTPADSSLSLIANGNVTLVSADYRPVNRIWSGTACDTFADDADSGVVYSGTWNSVSDDPVYYRKTCRYGNTTNGYFQYTFKGTQVEWFGLKNVDLGKADVYIDGVLAAGGIDCYSTTRMSQLLFKKTGLTNASHIVKVVVTGQKNSASSGTYLVHDYFAYTAGSTMVDDAAAGVTYSGTWNTDNTSTYYNNTCHYGNTTNGYFQTTFTGTQVNWYGLKNVDLGKADVYIDNVLVGNDVDCYGTVRNVQLLFSKSGLSYGSHTIKVVVTGIKNPASAGTYLVHDLFEVK